MIPNKKRPCDLCSLFVEIEGFSVLTTEGVKKFCCEGCKSIYRMLHEELILPDTDKKLADK
jgi:hypothetical protein